ncbi:hypothetical protein RF55_3739 [Lasius niger]|uniref:Uncharacterized protein n=1 Tax=Lasius niger TaxID=67767 RepID=A0A0J7KZM3_LASNI|nr:hypothetical protein RF55_3739 [Lasius niger]
MWKKPPMRSNHGQANRLMAMPKSMGKNNTPNGKKEGKGANFNESKPELDLPKIFDTNKIQATDKAQGAQSNHPLGDRLKKRPVMQKNSDSGNIDNAC